MHRENVALLTRYQSRRFSLQFCSACFQGTSVRCNDTVPLTVWRHHQVQLLLFSQRLQHPELPERHPPSVSLFAALPPVRRVSASTVVRLSIASFCISLPLPQPVWRFAVLSRFPALVRLASAVRSSSRFPAHRFAAPRRHFFCPSFYYTDDAPRLDLPSLIAPLAKFANPA